MLGPMSLGRGLGFVVVVVALASACGSTNEGDGAGDPAADVDGGTVADGGAANPGPGADGAVLPGVDASGDAAREAATPDAAIGPTYTGEATYYAADGTGACGFPATSNLDVAAMNKAQYSKSVCGKCARVTGPKGEVTVRIVDLCPGCSMGDLDLSVESFVKIANKSAGRVKISWSFVTCP